MTFFSFCRLTALVTLAMFATVLIDRTAPSVLISQAVAQDEKKEPRETRRTPALRNKVYERLAEAQVLAEEKNYIGAKEILDDMISEEGKRALNSYELANVYNLQAFLSYSKEDYQGSLRYYELVIAQPDIPLGDGD